MGQIPGKFGKTVKKRSKRCQPEIHLKDKKNDEKFESEQDSNNKISRRDFLKYGVGAAAVVAGATALMSKIPIPAEQPKTPAANNSAEPIVASVSGDQLTVMERTDFCEGEGCRIGRSDCRQITGRELDCDIPQRSTQDLEGPGCRQH